MDFASSLDLMAGFQKGTVVLSFDDGRYALMKEILETYRLPAASHKVYFERGI